ncbi:MAG: 4-oxalocrotonate tautomerase [Candidatus Margulisbacteria bacterium GWF2_35_9]|nr:MAG: 4-oxalocrotonate tautomerase [Candidatus Margulisbacteria bacterium GWF2_35_9]
MPYINVKVAGKLKKSQKEEIAKGMCDVLKKVAGKEKDTVYIVFDEVERENWAVGDELLA